jgi:PAS domain S-box-containing protein
LNAPTLAEMQQSLALALASIEAGFLATDRQGRITRLNEEAARVLGWTEAEALGRSYWDVFAREGRPASHQLTNPVDLMLQQGLSVRDQQRVVAVARDGRRTLLHVNTALTHTETGAVHGMIAVFRDLSAQTEAETRRQQEQERLRRVFEASPNGILLVDSRGRIALANRRAEAMFGHAPGALEGLDVTALVPHPRATSTAPGWPASLPNGRAARWARAATCTGCAATARWCRWRSA